MASKPKDDLPLPLPANGQPCQESPTPHVSGSTSKLAPQAPQPPPNTAVSSSPPPSTHPPSASTTSVRTVYIKNLSLTVDSVFLKITCSPYGDVTNVKVIRDVNGLSKGFAFVTFKEADQARKAISMLNGKELDGRVLFAGPAIKRSTRHQHLNQTQYAQQPAQEGPCNIHLQPIFRSHIEERKGCKAKHQHNDHIPHNQHEDSDYRNQLQLQSNKLQHRELYCQHEQQQQQQMERQHSPNHQCLSSEFTSYSSIPVSPFRVHRTNRIIDNCAVNTRYITDKNKLVATKSPTRPFDNFQIYQNNSPSQSLGEIVIFRNASTLPGLKQPPKTRHLRNGSPSPFLPSLCPDHNLARNSAHRLTPECGELGFFSPSVKPISTANTASTSFKDLQGEIMDKSSSLCYAEDGELYAHVSAEDIKPPLHLPRIQQHQRLHQHQFEQQRHTYNSRYLTSNDHTNFQLNIPPSFTNTRSPNRRVTRLPKVSAALCFDTPERHNHLQQGLNFTNRKRRRSLSVSVQPCTDRNAEESSRGEDHQKSTRAFLQSSRTFDFGHTAKLQVNDTILSQGNFRRRSQAQVKTTMSPVLQYRDHIAASDRQKQGHQQLSRNPPYQTCAVENGDGTSSGNEQFGQEEGGQSGYIGATRQFNHPQDYEEIQEQFPPHQQNNRAQQVQQQNQEQNEQQQQQQQQLHQCQYPHQRQQRSKSFEHQGPSNIQRRARADSFEEIPVTTRVLELGVTLRKPTRSEKSYQECRFDQDVLTSDDPGIGEGTMNGTLKQSMSLLLPTSENAPNQSQDDSCHSSTRSRDNLPQSEIVTPAQEAGSDTSHASQGINLYVKHLSDEVDDAMLKEIFSKFGEVISAKVMMEGDRSRGFGFVCFSRAEDAARATRDMRRNVDDVNKWHFYVAPAQRKEERQAFFREKLKTKGHNLLRAGGEAYAAGVYPSLQPPEYGLQGDTSLVVIDPALQNNDTVSEYHHNVPEGRDCQRSSYKNPRRGKRLLQSPGKCQIPSLFNLECFDIETLRKPLIKPTRLRVDSQEQPTYNDSVAKEEDSTVVKTSYKPGNECTLVSYIAPPTTQDLTIPQWGSPHAESPDKMPQGETSSDAATITLPKLTPIGCSLIAPPSPERDNFKDSSNSTSHDLSIPLPTGSKTNLPTIQTLPDISEPENVICSSSVSSKTTNGSQALSETSPPRWLQHSARVPQRTEARVCKPLSLPPVARASAFNSCASLTNSALNQQFHMLPALSPVAARRSSLALRNTSLPVPFVAPPVDDDTSFALCHYSEIMDSKLNTFANQFSPVHITTSNNHTCTGTSKKNMTSHIKTSVPKEDGSIKQNSRAPPIEDFVTRSSSASSINSPRSMLNSRAKRSQIVSAGSVAYPISSAELCHTGLELQAGHCKHEVAVPTTEISALRDTEIPLQRPLHQTLENSVVVDDANNVVECCNLSVREMSQWPEEKQKAALARPVAENIANLLSLSGTLQAQSHLHQDISLTLSSLLERGCDVEAITQRLAANAMKLDVAEILNFLQCEDYLTALVSQSLKQLGDLSDGGSPSDGDIKAQYNSTRPLQTEVDLEERDFPELVPGVQAEIES